MKHRVHRFPNGLTIATAEMPQMASVSVGLWVGVGGRFERAELNGAAHFIEHMLFKGTERRSAHQISQAVEGIGGYLNAFTSEENTCFYAKAPAEHCDRLLEVLLDMFLNSRFDPDEIAKERDVIKEEVAMYIDQPQHLVHDVLNETMWPNHPLGRTITGTEQTLDALGRKELLGFQATNYVAPVLLISVGGNIKHEKVVRSLSRYVSKVRPGKRPSFDCVNGEQQAPRVRMTPKETNQMQLAIGIRACSRHDEGRFALRLLNTLLAENASSRLFQTLREDHGLTYSIHSSVSHYDDTGMLAIDAGLDSDDISKTMKLLVEEMRRFREVAPSAKELREARDYLTGQMDLGLESTENQMMWLGEQILGYGKVIPPEQIKERLADVRPAQVRQAARECFRPERVSVSVVSPMKKDPGFEKWISRVAP